MMDDGDGRLANSPLVLVLVVRSTARPKHATIAMRGAPFRIVYGTMVSHKWWM